MKPRINHEISTIVQLCLVLARQYNNVIVHRSTLVFMIKELGGCPAEATKGIKASYTPTQLTKA